MALKKTSGVVVISSNVGESAANTYTEQEIDLSLDILGSEVFVIQAVDIDPNPPDAVATVNTEQRGCLSTTSRTTMGTISDSNVMAFASHAIRASGFIDSGVGISSRSPDSPTASTLDSVGICATSNMFLGTQGTNNNGAKNCQVRIWGYRAKADASTYAALVQSEVLSA